MAHVNDIIREVSQISSSAGAPDLTWPLTGILEKGDKAIDVAVVGQFKSGKSSLVNSLIGVGILPVGIVPVTAIVTRIRYGILPKLNIQFTIGDVSQVVPVDKLSVAIAIILSAVILHEIITWKIAIGASLIIGGTIVLII
jgi:hypothetical protein